MGDKINPYGQDEKWPLDKISSLYLVVLKNTVLDGP